MKSDQLDFIITLKAHQQRGSDDNVHTYKVFLDGIEQASNTIVESKFIDSFAVKFSAQLEPGEHNIRVYYRNNEYKGVLQILNMYVAGPKGGLNLDSTLNQEGYVSYGENRIEKNRTGIWHHGSYHFNFQSPFFYWMLYKFPI